MRSENPYQAYQAAKARHIEFHEKHQRIELKAKDNEKLAELLQFDVERARKKFAASERKFVSEDITESELNASKAELDELEARLEKAKKISKLSFQSLPEIRNEMGIASSRAEFFLRQFCKSEEKKIADELNTDETKQRFLTAYASRAVAGAWLQNWSGFLSEIFAAPSNEDLSKAAAQFREKHKV